MATEVKVKFKDGSESKVISNNVKNTRLPEIITYYRKYPVDFIKDTLPDMWDNLYRYQKIYISLFIKARNLKERFVTLIPKQVTCVNCGKKFKSRHYYYKPCCGSGKTIMEAARFKRTMCCSDGCFTEIWNKFWDGV